MITSDHTGPSEIAYYNTKIGMFRIPIVFYQPGTSLQGWDINVTQQTDIMPGILDYLHYDEPFSAFGNSLLDTTRSPFAVNFAGDVFQAMDNTYLIQYDGSDIAGCYNYKTDSLLFNNIYSDTDESQIKLTKTLQSVLQQYNRSMIRNELIPISKTK